MATMMDRVVTVQAPPTTARRGYQQQMQGQYQYQYHPNHNYNTKATGSATIQIVQPQVVSPTNSTVTFTPTTVSWGYGDQLVVRATIRDGNNNPLSGINVIYVRLYNSAGSAILYNDGTVQTTRSDGQVQYTINVDNISSSNIPQTGAIVEVGVQDGTTVVRIRASQTLTITGKARTVTVTPNKSSYNYGETITITIDMTDSANNSVRGAPVYVRIRQGTTVIKDFGQVATRLRSLSQPYQIAVNTTNFPQAGSYTIEVADNSSYSATAVPTQLDLNSLLMPMLSLILIIGIMSTMTRSIRI